MRWESYNPIVNSLEIWLNWINPIVSQNNHRYVEAWGEDTAGSHITEWHSIAVWLSIPFLLFDWAEVRQSILNKIRDSGSGVAAKSPPRLNGNTSARYLADDVSGRQNMLKSWYWKQLEIKFTTEKNIRFNWCVCELTAELVAESLWIPCCLRRRTSVSHFCEETKWSKLAPEEAKGVQKDMLKKFPAKIPS
jgi:hypothetical protein